MNTPPYVSPSWKTGLMYHFSRRCVPVHHQPARHSSGPASARRARSTTRAPQTSAAGTISSSLPPPAPRHCSPPRPPPALTVTLPPVSFQTAACSDRRGRRPPLPSSSARRCCRCPRARGRTALGRPRYRLGSWCRCRYRRRRRCSRFFAGCDCVGGPRCGRCGTGLAPPARRKTGGWGQCNQRAKQRTGHKQGVVQPTSAHIERSVATVAYPWHRMGTQQREERKHDAGLPGKWCTFETCPCRK